MKKEQALQLIDQLISQFRGTRQEHELLAQAMSVLRELEEPKEKKRNKK
jgi:hypothetical protein